MSKQYSKPYFPRPSPVDIQFEEKADFAQFNGESIVEWNIDGMLEYQIRTIAKYMLMYASAAKLKGNKDEAIAKAIITGFTGQLQGWWDFYLKETAREKILKAVRIDPTSNETKSDAVNTLIYTIMAHFVGANELLSNRTTEQLINLQCPTLSYFYWYRQTFMAIVMTRKDCNEDFWKEKFLSGLPKAFAERMRNKLKAKYNNNIPYSQLEYGDLAAEVIAEGINFCNDLKLKRQFELERQGNREILGNFCEQIGYQPIDYPKKETKDWKKKRKKDYHPKEKFKRKEKTSSNEKLKVSKGKGKRKNIVICWRCGQVGHYANRCKVKKKLGQSIINTSIIIKTKFSQMLCSRKINYHTIEKGSW
ncbi:hypothetical protein CDL12_00787 [Handroanthus impetiginosus]|uniref:CCHC-type domain-containing protein n=1 Tax=Handroanthus impetiginosus TaxID=429701 RepID=A0A2G9I9N3_9LAMI|nr:hypothetical protein CDL12_00787 [Handroanthus impetiginosus]